MKNQYLTAKIELEKVREWVETVNPSWMSIFLPEFFEEMGFPKKLVRKCIQKHCNLWLNNGKTGDAYGVSDICILAALAEGLCVYSEGDKFLCISNRVKAWQDACIVKLDEIACKEKQLS
jgi:hypothetical protein